LWGYYYSGGGRPNNFPATLPTFRHQKGNLAIEKRNLHETSAQKGFEGGAGLHRADQDLANQFDGAPHVRVFTRQCHRRSGHCLGHSS
jgi:hypothetical protein